MKIRLTALLAASILLLLALPSTAQFSMRAPTIVAALEIDDAVNAHPFHPDVQIFVTGAESATIEASEPDHSCAPGADSHSVWFLTKLMPGTLTLDTSGSSYTTGGGSSANTVISLYQLNADTFLNFTDISALTCNDNGAGAGIINAFNITSPGTYMVQISAAPGVTVTGPSEVRLLANYTAAAPIGFDEPDGARKLKMPSLPAIINISNATVALDEPVDPLAVTGDPVPVPLEITNTVWFKFTYSERRIFGVTNFYNTGSEIWFSLFQKDGAAYVPASGVLSSNSNSLTAILDAGTYYLRVGIVGEPEGSSSPFTTFTTAFFANPPNFEFTVGATEGGPGATPDLSGWTVKNGTAADTVFCDGPPSYECGFRFTSEGATEATLLKSGINLNAVKFKKGDIITLQLSLLDMVGIPNLKFTVTFTDAAGAKQVHTLNVTSDQEAAPALISQIPATFSPVKVVIKLKNKDTTSGNSIEIDGVIAGVLRVGEGVVRGGTLKLPLGGNLSAAWTTAPEGLLPVPPAAQ